MPLETFYWHSVLLIYVVLCYLVPLPFRICGPVSLHFISPQYSFIPVPISPSTANGGSFSLCADRH